MAYILATSRLRLRLLNYDDADFIVRLMNTTGWLTFVGDKNVKSQEAARTYLEDGPVKSYRHNGFGLYLVEIKESATAIGMCGFLKRDTLPHPDMGFAMLPEFSGQGYAREIAGATLGYAKHGLQLPKILAITKPDNQRSIALLEKIGLTFVEKFESPTNKKELLLYAIDLNNK